MIKIALEVEDYQSVHDAIKAHKKLNKLPKGHHAQSFKMYWNALSTEPEEKPNLVLYNSRIFVPRTEALNDLRKQHCGEKKTLQLARSLYFWPGMTQAIKDKIGKCPQCLELRPSRPAKPLIQTLDISRLFEAVSVDLGYLRGGGTYLQQQVIAITRY